MKYLKLLVIKLYISLSLIGCAVNEDPSNFSFKSRDWIKAKYRDINAEVNVQRVMPQYYSIDYNFSVPIAPMGRGTSPDGVTFFTFCLSSYISAKNGFTHWSILKDVNSKSYNNFIGDTSLNFKIVVLNKNQSPDNIVKRNDLQSLAVQSNNDHRSGCGFLNRKYQWW